MTDWIKIGQVDDIPKLGARTVDHSDGTIAVFRCADDSIFALRNRCPHKQGPLSEGIVHGQRVTCPLHSWVIDLSTGEAVAPDVGCAPPLPVKIIDGTIWLHAPALQTATHG